MKYGLNLKFTKLEVLEVGLWAKMLKVAGHEEDPQLPDEQQSEPPKPQPPQHTSIPTSELPVKEQCIETDQKTSMATQWSCRIPVVLPIVGKRNGPHMQQVGQGQHGIEHVSIQGLCLTQVNINGRFSQPSPHCPASANRVNVSDSCSSRQVLMQTAINSIQKFNGTNPEATIPWQDHIKSVTKNMGFGPVEMGMSKLKGTVLCNVSAASKEDTLSYFWFSQLLMEHYSNIPYASDALNTYAHLAQGKHELVTQYISKAKVLLEHIHNASKMCKIPGVGYDKLYLVRTLHSPHARWRVVSKQDTWLSMEDVIQTIEHITRSEEWNRAFFNPSLEASRPVIQVNGVSYGEATWQYGSDHPNNNQPPVWFHNTFRENNKQPRGPFRKSLGQPAYKHGPKKILCYYCDGEHLIKDCVKMAKEKSQDKQKDTEVTRWYKTN